MNGISVEIQKDQGGKNGSALVAIYKGVVQDE
jgi:hypothetical protein